MKLCQIAYYKQKESVLNNIPTTSMLYIDNFIEPRGKK
jgi:hypothetical protein